MKGYWHVWVEDHPYPKKGTHYVAEHRLVMEKKLGRHLLPFEVVHHIDGDKENNSEDNLIVFQTNAAHLKEELKGRVPNWTPEGKERRRKSNEGIANRRRGKKPCDWSRLQSNDHLKK
jgi:hypothetical protein